MTGLEPLIARHPFFADLPPRYLELVTGCASNHVLEQGRMLFREGEPADQFFLLREGRVALEINVPQRGAVVFETIDENDVLGWSWLAPPYRWSFDARAVTRLHYLAFDATCLRAKMAADHELGYALMQRFMPVLIARMQAARVRMLDLFGDIPPTRQGRG